MKKILAETDRLLVQVALNDWGLGFHVAPDEAEMYLGPLYLNLRMR